MIIDPDFLNHWKTQMLIQELDDKAAPVYLIALWSHCQHRKTDKFNNMAPNALKAICRYEGEASKLRSALERCGFLDVDGEAIIAHGWAELNAKLVANWSNGEKGGRPRENPVITQTDIGLSQVEPIEKIEQIDKIEKSKSSAIMESRFESFWEKYPRKISKQAARTVFFKIKPSEELLLRMLNAVDLHKLTRDWKDQNGKFIPYPERWLSKKRWEDDHSNALKPEDFSAFGKMI